MTAWETSYQMVTVIHARTRLVEPMFVKVRERQMTLMRLVPALKNEFLSEIIERTRQQLGLPAARYEAHFVEDYSSENTDHYARALLARKKRGLRPWRNIIDLTHPRQRMKP